MIRIENSNSIINLRILPPFETCFTILKIDYLNILFKQLLFYLWTELTEWTEFVVNKNITGR